MKTLVILFVIFAAGGTLPSEIVAQRECPPEVAQAQEALKSAQATLKSKTVATGPRDLQAPRAQAGARTQDVNAPRTQGTPAPTGAKVREQDIDAPRVKQAETLVVQAQAACKKGDMTTASAKAKQALAALK